MHSTILTAILLAPMCLAHMQMTKPYPFKSPYDPANDYTVIDYSMNAPLEQDGSNYPCKGYTSLLASTPAKDTLTAGQSYSITVGGTASHNGGSCQIALSYDQGKTFAVVHSMIGGCPLTNEYEFMVPASAPAAEKVILSWTWINHSGNREFYQNCSPVKVVNSNAQATLRAPTLFRANSFADGTCISPEGLDVVFPNPGASVVYGGAYAGNKPSSASQLPNCAFNAPKTIVISAAGLTSVVDGITEEGSDEALPTSVVPESSSSGTPSKTLTEPDSFHTTSATEEDSFTTTTKEGASSSAPSSYATSTQTEVAARPATTSKPMPTNVITEDDTYTTKEASEIFSVPGKVHITTEVQSSSTTLVFVTSTSSVSPPRFTKIVDSAPSRNAAVPMPPAATEDEQASPASTPIAAPSPIATSDSESGCANNELRCTGEGYTFDSCWDDQWIAMGSVAAGTVCRHGGIVMDFPEEACEDSAIKCTTATTWSLCASNSYIAMGSVAAGTQCLDGKIVALPAQRMRKRRLHSLHKHRPQTHGRTRHTFV